MLGHSPGSAPTWAAPGQRWAILTAWNPHGERRGRLQNVAAQAQLLAEVAAWPHLTGVNGQGQWAEQSALVLGLGLSEAVKLGRRYQQAALVWGVGQRAALVWCTQPASLERYWLEKYSPTL